ncbi:MAG: hypothetical protein ABI361_12525, partial [Nitrososphaera sp.]
MSRQKTLVIGILAAVVIAAALMVNAGVRQTTMTSSSPVKTNMTGKSSSNETGAIIQPPQPQPKGLRIAFVRQNFTYAAYQLGSFYNFYNKYDSL